MEKLYVMQLSKKARNHHIMIQYSSIGVKVKAVNLLIYSKYLYSRFVTAETHFGR